MSKGRLSPALGSWIISECWFCFKLKQDQMTETQQPNRRSQKMAKVSWDVAFEAEAIGTKNSTLPEGKKLQFKGTRLGIVFDNDNEVLTAEQAGELIGQVCDEVNNHVKDKANSLTPRRVVEYAIDNGWIKTRVYQGTTSLFMREENRVPTPDEDLAEAIERFTASGRGGARGPRMTDQDVIKAAIVLGGKDPKFAQLKDLVENAKLTEIADVVQELRQAYAAADLSVEQVKELAKAA